MKYPVNIVPDDPSGFFVSFPDIPEALTCGDDMKEAKEMAYDALLTAFSIYFNEEKKIPLPSCVKSEHYIALPASVVSKILLLNAMVDAGISKSELGRRVGIKKQNINHLLDIFHASKIDTVEKALNLLGKDLELIAA